MAVFYYIFIKYFFIGTKMDVFFLRHEKFFFEKNEKNFASMKNSITFAVY